MLSSHYVVLLATQLLSPFSLVYAEHEIVGHHFRDNLSMC